MMDWRSANEWRRLWRYYQAGVVNTAFGFCLYALFVWMGMNIYLAQILSHTLGVVFNYFSYSRYAFADSQASKIRFGLSYIGNYFLGLACLAVVAQFIVSPYLAGLVSTLFVSLVNFFVLNKLVFNSKRTTS